MIKLNIFIALFSLVSGIANIAVGQSSSSYSMQNLSLASVQVLLACVVLVTGLSKIKLFFNNDLLTSVHVYCSVVFYLYIAAFLAFFM